MIRSFEVPMPIIILHDGPLDGKEMTISRTLFESGRVRVPIMDEPRTDFNEPRIMEPSFIRPKIGLYQRQTMSQGMPGTCEHRSWFEWHYKGES